MPANETCTVELKPAHLEYLDDMVEKHGLPDRSKALRILVTYARVNAHLQEEIFREVRCRDCG